MGFWNTFVYISILLFILISGKSAVLEKYMWIRCDLLYYLHRFSRFVILTLFSLLCPVKYGDVYFAVTHTVRLSWTQTRRNKCFSTSLVGFHWLSSSLPHLTPPPGRKTFTQKTKTFNKRISFEIWKLSIEVQNISNSGLSTQLQKNSIRKLSTETRKKNQFRNFQRCVPNRHDDSCSKISSSRRATTERRPEMMVVEETETEGGDPTWWRRGASAATESPATTSPSHAQGSRCVFRSSRTASMQAATKRQCMRS